MGIAEAKLDMSYRFSTDVKLEMLRLLTSSAHLLRLIDIMSQYIKGDIKTRSKKPFAVIIINTASEVKTKGEGSSGRAKSVRHSFQRIYVIKFSSLAEGTR
jgi:hypothetical protein